jgi:hypothetical protein
MTEGRHSAHIYDHIEPTRNKILHSPRVLQRAIDHNPRVRQWTAAKFPSVLAIVRHDHPLCVQCIYERFKTKLQPIFRCISTR